MKNIIFIVLVNVCLVAFYSGAAQESKGSLIFSGSLRHFEGKQNHLVASDVSNINNYYVFPLDPGIGIFYQYQIFTKNSILLGVNYQISHIASTEDAIHRFRYKEPSISVFLKHYFFKSDKIGFFSALGLSYGQMKLKTAESYGHQTWSSIETRYLKNYSDDDSFNDIIINAGLFIPSYQIEFVPSVGYRINDNWVSYYRQRFFYGLTINYQLKFSKQ